MKAINEVTGFFLLSEIYIVLNLKLFSITNYNSDSSFSVELSLYIFRLYQTDSEWTTRLNDLYIYKINTLY